MKSVLEKMRDGSFFLLAVAYALIGSGLFAIGLGLTGTFLPHDERFLGMTARELCSMHECRIVHFMIHDRISFGGALIAIGILYHWLTVDPLRQGFAWAWRLLLVSGVVGFSSFFAYLGYGYLDTWHGLATLALLPCFVFGLALSFPKVSSVEHHRSPWNETGRAFLLASAAGLIMGGAIIFIVGVTCVFVPQDLAYMGLSVDDLKAIHNRLIPLIAHDRAGFGGAVCCCGVTLFFCIWRGNLSFSLWRVLVMVGIAGFGSAIGVHPAIGYNDALHLAPAVLGALLYLIGLILTYPTVLKESFP